MVGLVTALVIARSAIFLIKPHIAFDSDQAVIGLMAKHLVEGRAFPLFMYGQNYMLGVEAWLAAPAFMLFGVSIAALKTPLLLFNVCAAVLLIRLLVRDAGLPGWTAVIATLFFVLPPPGTTASLLEAGGGNVEPLVYVLLLWTTRRRPGWFGLVLAIGVLHREFTVYGFAAFVAIAAATGDWRRPGWWSTLGSALRVAVELWLVVQWLRGFSSPAGPGTTMADVSLPMNVTNVVRRFCVDPRMFVPGLHRLATVHWPALFGTAVQPTDFALTVRFVQGTRGVGLVLAATAILMAVRVAMHVRVDAGWWRRSAFPVYLTIAGLLSALVYALGRCGVVSVETMRYDLLSLLGAVGLSAWFFQVETRRMLRVAATAGIVFWAIATGFDHARLWAEYGTSPAPTDKQQVIRQLEARGVKYVLATYWYAYYIDFATDERIIAAAEDYSRIREYDRLVAEHRAEAVRIERNPCSGGFGAMPGVYFCPP